MFCSSLYTECLDKQARTGAGAMAPSLDEQDDHFEECEGLLVGEPDRTLWGYAGLPGDEVFLKLTVPGAKLPVGAKFHRDRCFLAKEYRFEHRPAVALVGE